VHHPFTAPHAEDEPLLASAPLSVRGQHYDVVVDGVELGGGSVRVHNAAMQTRIFELLGVRDPEAVRRFAVSVSQCV
jgi:aspartyl-tRNA synthetase